MVKANSINGISFDKIIIFILLIIHFQLLMPFNVSDSFFLRLFTTDKVTYYLVLIVILSHLSQGRLIIIKQIPGIWLLVTIICSMAISNYLATESGVPQYGSAGIDRSVNFIDLQQSNIYSNHWKQFIKEMGSILLMISTILVLNSYSNIYIYLKWSIYFVIFLAIVSILPIEASDVLPLSSKADIIQETISGQAETQNYYNISTTLRHHVLWIDANNYGFYLVPAIFSLIFLINYQRTGKIRFPYFFLLGFLLINLLFTQSRGSLFCLLIGLVVLIYYYRSMMVQWVVPAIFFIFFLFLLSFSNVVNNQLSNFYDRIFFATKIFSTSGQFNVSGDESNRVISAYYAIQDILDKPFLGWGSAFQVGRYSTTGNHIGWLNLFGKYGLIGAGLMVCFLFNYLWRFFKSLKYRVEPFTFEKNLGYCLMAIYTTFILSGLFKTASPIEIAPLAISFYLVTRVKQVRQSLL